jgi:spore germination protein KC
MSKMGRKITLVLLCFTLLCTPGCWNRREVETLAFVGSFGIDLEAGNKVQLTARIVRPEALPSGTSGAGGGTTNERAFWLATSTGDTVFEAIRNFLTQSSRRLYWPHARFIVIGEKMAQSNQLPEVLDYFDRNWEFRRTARILVVRGTTAADFLQTEFEQDRLPLAGLTNLMEASAQGYAGTVIVNLNQFLQMLEGEGIEPTATRVEIIPKNPGDIRGQTIRMEVKKSPLVNGAAVFKGGRLVGWLDQSTTRGLLWVKGQVKGGIVNIPQPGTPNKLMSMELLQEKTRIKPILTAEGKPLIQVKVDLIANIGEIQAPADPSQDPEFIPQVNQLLAEAVVQEIRSVLYIAQQEFNTDIFGFGAAINRKYPQLWQDLKNRWNDEFPHLEVQVAVTATTRRAGLTGKGTQVKGVSTP